MTTAKKTKAEARWLKSEARRVERIWKFLDGERAKVEAAGLKFPAGHVRNCQCSLCRFIRSGEV